MKKYLIIFLTFFLCSIVSAEELVSGASSAILIEASTGKVLYEYKADEAHAPASMTKMMTLLLTMEAVDSGKISLEDMVFVSDNAASMGGSQVYLEPKSEYKLDEIIKAVCIASGNDAAVVLAETIGGTEANFVNMMNKKAKELGLTSTNFVNAYGLDAQGHVSSARDMAIIARELIKHENILKYSSMYEYYLKKQDGSSIWMVNTNKLVHFYNGVDGLKTGFTNKAGYCLTATGKWNDMRLISVVMGEENSDIRTKDTTNLLNYGRRMYKVNKIISKDDVLGKVKIENSIEETYEFTSSSDIVDLINTNDEEKKYTYNIIKTDKLHAPIDKTKEIGKIQVYDKDTLIDEKPIILKMDAVKCNIWKNIYNIMKIIIIGNF